MTLRGITYPFGRSETSFPAVSDGDAVVLDNIERTLRNRRGSRVMRRDVGSDAILFVFENVNPVTSARLDYEVRRAIADNEPRATVLSVGMEQVDTETIVTVDVEVNRRARRIWVRFPR